MHRALVNFACLLCLSESASEIPALHFRFCGSAELRILFNLFRPELWCLALPSFASHAFLLIFAFAASFLLTLPTVFSLKPVEFELIFPRDALYVSRPHPIYHRPSLGKDVDKGGQKRGEKDGRKRQNPHFMLSTSAHAAPRRPLRTDSQVLPFVCVFLTSLVSFQFPGRWLGWAATGAYL